jgi:hypothetical protein
VRVRGSVQLRGLCGNSGWSTGPFHRTDIRFPVHEPGHWRRSAPWAVQYSPDISALVRKEAPDGLAAATKIRKAEQLTYAEVLDIPDPEGPWEDELELNDQVRDDYGMFRPDSDMFGYFSPTTGEDKDTQPFLSIRPTEGCGIHIQLKRADLAVGDFDAAQLVWVDCG